MNHLGDIVSSTKNIESKRKDTKSTKLLKRNKKLVKKIDTLLITYSVTLFLFLVMLCLQQKDVLASVIFYDKRHNTDISEEINELDNDLSIPVILYSESLDYEEFYTGYDEVIEEEEVTEVEEESEDDIEEDEEEYFTWEGEVLNKRVGVVDGPVGKETYYNLNMSGVVYYMRLLGYEEEEYPYWVRDDGAKMFGKYVMVAANLDVYPKGSIIPCSLGMAIVCDTGSFAKNNYYQLDVAVTW